MSVFEDDDSTSWHTATEDDDSADTYTDEFNEISMSSSFFLMDKTIMRAMEPIWKKRRGFDGVEDIIMSINAFLPVQEAAWNRLVSCRWNTAILTAPHYGRTLRRITMFRWLKHELDALPSAKPRAQFYEISESETAFRVQFIVLWLGGILSWCVTTLVAIFGSIQAAAGCIYATIFLPFVLWYCGIVRCRPQFGMDVLVPVGMCIPSMAMLPLSALCSPIDATCISLCILLVIDIPFLLHRYWVWRRSVGDPKAVALEGPLKRIRRREWGHELIIAQFFTERWAIDTLLML